MYQSLIALYNTHVMYNVHLNKMKNEKKTNIFIKKKKNDLYFFLQNK